MQYQLDIYKRLKLEHDRQRSLLSGIESSSCDVKDRFRLLDELGSELEAHAAAEEQTLYAELLVLSQDRLLAQCSVAEHDEAARLIVELYRAPCHASWAPQARKLKEVLLHHLENEESMIFQRARNLISQSRAVALGRQFRVLKRYHLRSWGGPPLTTNRSKS